VFDDPKEGTEESTEPEPEPEEGPAAKAVIIEQEVGPEEPEMEPQFQDTSDKTVIESQEAPTEPPSDDEDGKETIKHITITGSRFVPDESTLQPSESYPDPAI
jgi:hypothetical protein